MDLNRFMQKGIANIWKTAGRFYLKNKPGRAFLAGAVPQMQKSARLRAQNEAAGTHIPAFLIASVASQCNLHCAGCYARAGGACCGAAAEPDLSGDEWDRIFTEAGQLGVSFVLLAGGEPLLRRDVIDAAARHPELVFPLFTNGTLLGPDVLQLLDTHRNLIPVLSVEGGREETDARRGPGTFRKIEEAMAAMQQKGILFGVSVTVTKENLGTVLTQGFLSELRGKGCGLAVYVEYVPAEQGTEHLALAPADLARMEEATQTLKASFEDMVVLSFPGDEAAMGGCLASGRGFFHINPKGGAEPCPFSPHAKYSLKETSMRQVLCSGYFQQLRQIAADAGPHTGGCVLFQREKEVQALLAAQ